MIFQIDSRNQIPIWEQIVNQVKKLLLKGVLAPGDKMPSVRELASTLTVNPSTVSKAYQELERQGVIESLRGKGTFVTEQLPIIEDEKKVNQLKEEIKQLLIEGSYLGLTMETFIDWIRDYEKELGGKQND